MMDNLEMVLENMYNHVPVQEILAGEFQPDNIRMTDFVQIMRTYSNQYSDTELKNLYNYLTTNFYHLYHSAEGVWQEAGQLDVYELLRYYSEWILKIEDNEIVCEYSRFLHWRMVTRSISEDLLVTSFLAQIERQDVNHRMDFSWKTCITHNNRTLHKILDQGIAENHSHFKGAGPIFELTWVNMMNCPDLYHSRQIDEIEKNRRNVNIQYKPSYHEESFADRLLLAAFIRMILFHLVTGRYDGQRDGDKDFFGSNMFEQGGYTAMTALRDPKHLWVYKRNLSETIAVMKESCGLGSIPDYAITALHSTDKDPMTLVVQGERCILYEMFRMIYSCERAVEPYKDIFYAYLVIKENFRSELVQINDSVGFENFSIYEQRKDVFLENSFFGHAIVRKAVEASLFDSNVVVSEQRIAPKLSAKENLAYIRKMDSRADGDGKYRNRFFYVMHFIKAPDNSSYVDGTVCRNYRQRLKYRKQALALAQFRQEYPFMASRVKGIDAANQEIGCGPEVFAQVFRFLSCHIPEFQHENDISLPQLRITFHVGEDFLDLVSGLRAIDEACCFLGMRCGDRFGHALALGLNVREWYQSKNNRVLIPQQEYLDNVAWMYHLISEFQIRGQERMLAYFRKEFEYYFRIVYGEAVQEDYLDEMMDIARRYYAGTEWERFYSRGNYKFDIESYYVAWKLRGDAPELYREGFFANRSLRYEQTQTFSYYGVNRQFPKRQNQRYFREPGLLYCLYHYSPSVRRMGERTVEKKVTSQFVECVELIQREIQKRIVRRGLAIEVNPTSNFVIGTFKHYDRHPIVNLYNEGLVEDYDLLQKCPQIEVCINTDDSGIFDTSLENEYAYMALALEKAKDEDGNPRYKKQNIYKWIDNVRRMGLRQTFMTDDEFKRAEYEWEQERGKIYDGSNYRR